MGDERMPWLTAQTTWRDNYFEHKNEDGEYEQVLYYLRRYHGASAASRSSAMSPWQTSAPDVISMYAVHSFISPLPGAC